MQMEYPKEKLQIVIASDGSTDRTVDILKSISNVYPVILERAGGKAAALNEARKHATGEVLVFLDVRQRVATDALYQLTSYLADPEIGAVSGELLLEPSANSDASSGLGIYWRLEKMVRKLESASGSVVGVTGAIYAIRSHLYTEMPRGAILDDVFIPMSIARQGSRVVFCETALAYDQVSETRGKEFSRKVRTLTGNYQLLDLQPWLLTSSNPLRFRFFCHKLARLFVPFFLLFMLLASLEARGTLYRLAFWLQICVYGCALVGSCMPAAKRLKLIAIASTFVMLNASATVAFYNFISKRYSVWV
jgi:cellulose synthase/poly-beta-1,6-N-acetylglucosamine synthase-like glycosyltransferase